MTNNPQMMNYSDEAFALAVSFYKLFDIDPYKWAALYQGQVNSIELALRNAYGRGITDGMGEFNDQ